MYDRLERGLRVAGLMVLALVIAHCGDNDVNVRIGGTNPAAGTFVGTTSEGGAITIVVDSIRSVAFDCDDEQIQETFDPPRDIDADGGFSVRFTDGGREFRVHGTFTSNNTVHG